MALNLDDFPWTPRTLTTYTCSKLEEAFRTQGEEKTRRAIDQLFQVVCQITDLSPDALLTQLGFDPNNRDDDTVQSLFGVMRTVTTLRNLDFTEIIPLPPSNTHKEADLVARKNGMSYAVEVFRANERKWRYPGYKCEGYIVARYKKEKKAQLDATMARLKCTKSIVAVVFDSDSKALLDGSEIQSIVETVYYRTEHQITPTFFYSQGCRLPLTEMTSRYGLLLLERKDFAP